MKAILTSGLGAILALSLCAGAQAQSRGRQMTHFRIASPAGTHMTRGAMTRSNSAFLFNGSTFMSFDTISNELFPVPGLGFDFAHLAAISRGFRVHFSSQRFLPLTSLSLPFFPAFFQAPPEVIVVQQPPVVIVQQPAAVEDSPDESPRPRARARPAESAEAAQPSEPPHELGEFVLVRRDGRVVFAVAFSAEGDRLVYVTREGVRRSLPLAELDLDTTQRMNEERGTTLHLPV